MSKASLKPLSDCERDFVSLQRRSATEGSHARVLFPLLSTAEWRFLISQIPFLNVFHLLLESSLSRLSLDMLFAFNPFAL